MNVNHKKIRNLPQNFSSFLCSFSFLFSFFLGSEAMGKASDIISKKKMSKASDTFISSIEKFSAYYFYRKDLCF